MLFLRNLTETLDEEKYFIYIIFHSSFACILASFLAIAYQ